MVDSFGICNTDGYITISASFIVIENVDNFSKRVNGMPVVSGLLKSIHHALYRAQSLQAPQILFDCHQRRCDFGAFIHCLSEL
jgi:hypothetical protein